MAGDYPTDRAGRVVPDGSWPAGREATGELERLRRFLNSTNLESGGEHFLDGPDVRAWLVREDHGDPGRLTDDDAASLRHVRETLRDAIVRADLRGLDDVLVDASLTVQFASDGARLVPGGAGIERLIGWIAATVHDAVLDGTWPRLKACVNSQCRWVSFDHSKNASGTWCSTRACGARAKARAYRARRKEHDHET
jgi:hypothetical protein